MPTNTYVALDTITLTGSASAVSFINIPPQYTDLVLVLNGVYNANNYVNIKLNNDTNTQSYSGTYLAGNGSSAGSGRFTNSGYGIGFTSGSPDNAIFHIMNYSSPNLYKNLLIKTAKSSSEARITVGSWRKFDIVNMINLLHDTSNGFAAGSTFTLYGISKASAGLAKATGGTIYYGSDGYIYHKFTSSGTFIPNQTLSAEVLLVSGGGGGGANIGGGGGTGFKFVSDASFSATSHTTTVGAGGASDTNGTSSLVGSYSSTGGPSGYNNSNVYPGGAQGGQSWYSPGSPYIGTGQNAGGQGRQSPSGGNRLGGGGAAPGRNGGDANTTSNIGGNGGNSNLYPNAQSFLAATNSGQLVAGTYYIAGGGAGGGEQNSYTRGTPGYGGGGIAGLGTTQANGSAGTANTGGGGGGAGGTAGVASGAGGTGGSGLVIIRYLA